MRVQKNLKSFPVWVFHEVELIIGLERLNSRDQPMLVGRYLDRVGSDRRVSDELAPKGLYPMRESTGRLHPVRPR